MTTIHTQSPFLSRALRRTVLGVGSLALCSILPAQFQCDYGTIGTPNMAEIGTCLVKMPTGYLLGGAQGNDVVGVLTNPIGGIITSARHVPTTSGLTLTPHCARRTATGVIVSGELQNGPVGGQDVFLAFYGMNGATLPTANTYQRYSGDATGIRQGTRVVERVHSANPGGFAVIANSNLAGVGERGVLFTTAANCALASWWAFARTGNDVRFHDLCEDTDGTFLIVGSMRSHTGPRRLTMVMRANDQGGIIWQRIYSLATGGEDVEQHAITRTDGGHFAVWGHFAPLSQTSAWPGSFLLEINGQGDLVFRTHFPAIAGSRPTITRVMNASGDLLMNGKSGDDALVLRTNSAGLGLVACTYGAPNPSVEEFFQVEPTADGGYVATGSTQMRDATDSNIYLVKADATGNSACNWLPFVVVQTYPAPSISTRPLTPMGPGTSTDLSMHPLVVPATDEHRFCLGPMPCAWTGNPTGTTGGLPTIGTGTPATVGNTGFQIVANGLMPNGLALAALSMALATPALPMGMLGGQPGSMLYLDPAVLVTFPMLSNAHGEGNLSFPIPGNPALTGLTLHWQIFDFDPSLPYPLPVGNSQAMSVTIQ